MLLKTIVSNRYHHYFHVNILLHMVNDYPLKKIRRTINKEMIVRRHRWKTVGHVNDQVKLSDDTDGNFPIFPWSYLLPFKCGSNDNIDHPIRTCRSGMDHRSRKVIASDTFKS